MKYVILRILAIPTAILGFLLSYDVYWAPPEHETTTVVSKYLKQSRGTHYMVRLAGKHFYERGLSQSDYDQIGIGNSVALTVTPLQKHWLRAAVTQRGYVAVDVLPVSQNFAFLSTLFFLIPCLSFFKRRSEPLRGQPKLLGGAAPLSFFWKFVLTVELGALWSVLDWWKDMRFYLHG